MDFDDLEDSEAVQASQVLEPKAYKYEEVPEDADDDKDEAVEPTLEALAKALTEERRERRRLERRLENVTRQLKAQRERIDEGPGLFLLEDAKAEKGKREPTIHPSAYIAPGAAVIGTVTMEQDSSVWFNCTVRGDNEQITIGKGSDVQDNSILHCDPGKPLTIGSNVLVGHQVCLHGCTIGDNCLIGMRTVMLDNSKVGSNCFVAAGSFIGEGREFPDNSLIGGNPAKRIADLDQQKLMIVKTAALGYVENKERYKEGLQPF